MIFCLFGSSFTGETTIARAVASQLGMPRRSRGDEVRKVAQELGVSFEDLPEDSHRQIDHDTVAWALEHRPCLVEGRFLDTVFVSRGVPAMLIRLVTGTETRLIRARQKDSTFTSDQLARMDAQDISFRARIYGPLDICAPCDIIDTSELTVEECVCQVAILIEQARLSGQRG
jgi:cytidylate kinase